MTRWFGCGLALLLLAGAPALAMEQDPSLQRYEARAIVTGTDMRSRPAGLAMCFVDVLVKVSGDPRLAADPAAAALAQRAGDFVADYDYWDRMSGIAHHDEQGSYDRPFNLTARFVPARIDAALRDLGRKPWPDPRPELVMVVRVHSRSNEFNLARGEPRAVDMRAALAASAAKYGMRVSVPPDDEFAIWQDMDASATAWPVVGTLAWSDNAHGWIADWHMRGPQQTYDWGIGGVNFDEAFRDAVRGAMQIASGNGAPH